MARPVDREANARQTIAQLGEVCRTCDRVLRALFQVPVRITIVIRVPGLSRGDTIFGDDDPAEAIEAIKRVTASRGTLQS